MVNTDNFFLEYSRMINKMIPVIGVLNSQKIETIISYNNTSVENWINDLNMLKGKYKSDRLYTRLIDARIFEQKELNELTNNPMFWVDNTLSAISANWRAKVLINNAEVLRCNINLLASSFPDRIKELKSYETKFSRVMGQKALSKIRRELEIISNFNDNFRLIEQDTLEKISLFSKELSDVIEDKCSDNPLIIPLNEKEISHYIYLTFGIKMDFSLLKIDLENLIKNLSGGYIYVKEEPKNFSDEDIMLVIQDIISCFLKEEIDYFSFIDTIKILKNKNRLNAKAEMTSYIKDIGSDGNYVGFLSIDGYNIDIERLKLKLVHEVFPGHHYQSSVLKNDKNICFTNSMLDEGWAKYAEFLYIKRRSNKKCSSYFLSSFRAIAISVYAMILLNVDNMNISEIADELTRKFDISLVSAKNIILMEYMDPLSSISYYIGFHTFLYFLKDFPISNVEEIKFNMRKVYSLFLLDGYEADYKDIRKFNLDEALKKIYI